ncbi:DUF3291 domain-containing protein [Allonocardiopsis opalescens]|uniref:Uncharacterized protein DUF3291 n=1 Tax=Allonocardiopsis opalescens TaxID=1144618 RepID=A0A2T0PZS8_9ACTN|nr:DUF3291 domain-containing protein [Allonocardiopsis opalescens]PRX97037.1 uncharacterized protein DUF3291 [Allonocardiopsis opalescens]
MTAHHLAQLNLVELRAPLESPEYAGFVALLDPINTLADRSPGFVWRLRAEDGADATSLRPFGPDVLVNLTVWETREALWDFTYRSGHLDALRRRREWFSPMARPSQVMWWTPAGTLPTVAEAARRLALLTEHGPGPDAFTFKDDVPAPGTPAAGLPG